jgi:putative phosphoesterase
MRIGIIADTHGLLRPEAVEALRGVDAIVHAGDVGGAHVLDGLRALAPVTYVEGNNDDGDGTDIVRVTLGGLRILLTHILPRPHKPDRRVVDSLRAKQADVVIFGHSHLPHDEAIDRAAGSIPPALDRSASTIRWRSGSSTSTAHATGRSTRVRARRPSGG